MTDLRDRQLSYLLKWHVGHANTFPVVCHLAHGHKGRVQYKIDRVTDRWYVVILSDSWGHFITHLSIPGSGGNTRHRTLSDAKRTAQDFDYLVRMLEYTGGGL